MFGKRPARSSNVWKNRDGFTIQLQGWNAILALIVLVAAAGARFWWLQSTLDERAAGAIRQELSNELFRESLAAGDNERLVAAVERAEGIQVTDLKARRQKNGIVVRAEFTVNGQPPADGRSVRYFVMSNPLFGDCRIRRTTTALTYYLALW